MTWVDHHCHLPVELDRAAEWLAAATSAGVEALINVGCDVASSQAAVRSARSHPGVWATAGLHPHDAKDGIAGIEELLVVPEVVAIGECGLDYHYLHSPADVQRRVFAEQIQLAHHHHLPLVIHSREAWDDTFDVLRAEGVPARTVFHCFSGGPDELRRCLDVDALVSFSGIVTFRSAVELQEAAQLAPLDHMLVETDSPYLAPVPHRGRPNEPANVAVVGAAVAALRGIGAEEVAAATTANARAFYGLDPAPLP